MKMEQRSLSLLFYFFGKFIKACHKGESTLGKKELRKISDNYNFSIFKTV